MSINPNRQLQNGATARLSTSAPATRLATASVQVHQEVHALEIADFARVVLQSHSSALDLLVLSRHSSSLLDSVVELLNSEPVVDVE